MNDWIDVDEEALCSDKMMATNSVENEELLPPKRIQIIPDVADEEDETEEWQVNPFKLLFFSQFIVFFGHVFISPFPTRRCRYHQRHHLPMNASWRRLC